MSFIFQFYKRLNIENLGDFKLSLVLVLFTWLVSSPHHPYSLLSTWRKQAPTEIWEVINRQIDHPLTPQYNLNPKSQAINHVFRVTMPLLGKLSFISANHWYARMLFLFILQHAAGVLFFYLLLKIARETGFNSYEAFLVGAGFACIYPGKSFYMDYCGYFDAMAYVFILWACYVKKSWLIFLLILGANFTDERAIIASLWIPVWWQFKNKRQLKWPIDKYAVTAIAAIAFTFVIRYIMQSQFGLKLPTMEQENISFFNKMHYKTISFIPVGLFSPLKLYWMLIIWMLASFVFKSEWRSLISNGIPLVLLLYIGVLAVDVTRSVAYAFPILLFSLKYLRENTKSMAQKKVLEYCLLFNFFIPTFFVQGSIYWPFISLELIGLIKV